MIVLCPERLGPTRNHRNIIKNVLISKQINHVHVTYEIKTYSYKVVEPFSSVDDISIFVTDQILLLISFDSQCMLKVESYIFYMNILHTLYQDILFVRSANSKQTHTKPCG